MKIGQPISHLLVAAGVSLALLTSALASDDERDKEDAKSGTIVVANRASGTLSLIDVKSDQVSATLTLPAGAKQPEPMYVVHTPKSDRVFVGDRANNRLVIYDDDNFELEGVIPTGRGVFHMWADPGEHQLWVSNDIDNTATVIDPASLELLATVPMPSDIVAMGGKPHDVILDPTGDAAYVTMLGVSGLSDYVIKFNTNNFTETARAEVGKDPHVSLTRRNKLLYVPTQETNAVYILNRADLSESKILSIPGAHGAGMARNGKTFYTTNLSGGGVDGLFSIDTKTNETIGQAVDTPFPVPHNIALTVPTKKLYVTHSGANATQVSVYTINPDTRLPELKTTVSVGNNPFGLTFVK